MTEVKYNSFANSQSSENKLNLSHLNYRWLCVPRFVLAVFGFQVMQDTGVLLLQRVHGLLVFF
jgi:hypothetical protein